LLRAMLDGHHVLDKVGARLEARGLLPLLQAGLSWAVAGSSIPLPSPRSGSQNRSELPRERCAPSSGYWRLACSSGRSGCLCNTMISRCLGTRGRPQRPRLLVILSLFAQVMMGQMGMDQTVSLHVYGFQPHHLTICDALEIDRVWYAPSLSRQNHGRSVTPPSRDGAPVGCAPLVCPV